MAGLLRCSHSALISEHSRANESPDGNPSTEFIESIFILGFDRGSSEERTSLDDEPALSVDPAGLRFAKEIEHRCQALIGNFGQLLGTRESRRPLIHVSGATSLNGTNHPSPRSTAIAFDTIYLPSGRQADSRRWTRTAHPAEHLAHLMLLLFCY